jgi:hypothetical protein
MSTKQQQTKNPNQAQQKKPKEAPQHAKDMQELTQPKAKIIQITREDQKKIANVKRILQELNFEGAVWPDEDIYTVLKERVNYCSEAEIYQAAALYIMEAREQPEQWQEVGGKAKKVKQAAADNKNRPRNPSDANRSPNTASGEYKPRGPRPQQRDQQPRQKKTEGGDQTVAKGQEHAAGAQNEQTQQPQQHQRQQSQQQQRGRGPRGQQQQQQPQHTNGVAPATTASTPANGTISWANKVKGEPKPQPPQQPQQTQEQKPAYKQKETSHATHGNPPSHPAQQHRTAPAVTKAQQQQQQQASQSTQASTAAPVREVSEIESNVSKLTINPATVNLPPLTSTPASSTVPSFGRVQDNGPRINLPGTGLEQPPGLKVHFGQTFETEKPKPETKTEQSPLPVVTQTPTLPQTTPVVPATQTPAAAKPQTPAEGAVPTMMPGQFPALFPFQYPMSLMNPQMFYDPSQLASAPTQTNAGRDQQDASANQQSTAGQPGVAPYQGYGTDAAAWANSLNTGAYPYPMQQLVNQQGYVAYQTQPNSQFYPPYGRPAPYQKGPYWNMNYGAYPQPYSGTEDQDYMKHSLSGQGYPQQHTAHTNPSQNRFFNNTSGTTGTSGQGMMDNKQQGVQQGQQGQAVGQQGQPGHTYGAEHEFPYGYHQSFQNYSSFVQPGMQVPQQLPYQQQRTNPNYQQ